LSDLYELYRRQFPFWPGHLLKVIALVETWSPQTQLFVCCTLPWLKQKPVDDFGLGLNAIAVSKVLFWEHFWSRMCLPVSGWPNTSVTWKPASLLA